MLRFGSAEIDLDARRVTLDGDDRHLEPQAFDLLAYLVSQRSRVVPKAELLDEVWGDQFVSESALTTRIKEVRQALGDSGARQEFVRNFRGRGYRFVAEAATAQSTAAGAPGAGSEPNRAALATTLLGRDRDLEAIPEMLTTSRLVTLVGSGGVGKTSLAAEIARRSRNARADGVIGVRLATVREPAGVIHTIRRATRLDESGDDEDFLRALGQRDALVVLDNCEHVIDEVARIVDVMLNEPGAATVLATSRERLGVASEQVWPVAVLELHAARSLLLARARAASPTFHFDDADGETVDRLLDALDRLPLAIEMAAARLPTIGVRHLADLVADNVGVLRSPDRSVDERHRTLSAMIAWSENLLEPHERGLLERFSVFHGPVIAQDVAGVVADLDLSDGAVIATLADLVERSMLVADTLRQPTRYRMLETVRAHTAAARPASSLRRHAEHFARIVDECDVRLRNRDEAAARQRIDGIVPELRAAHAWSRLDDVELAASITSALHLHAYSAHWAEPSSWAEDLVDRMGPDDPGRLGVLAALAGRAGHLGRFDRSRDLAEQAVVSDDPRVRLAALDSLIDVSLYTGVLDEAYEHAGDLIELATSLGDSYHAALGTSGLVLSSVYGGDVGGARRHLDAAPLTAEMGPTGRAWLAYVAGEVFSAEERIDEAIASFEQAIELAESVGSRFPAGVGRVSLLSAQARSGDTEAALAAFEPVLRLYLQTRNVTHGVTALRNLIELLVRVGDDEMAMRLLGALSKPSVKASYGTELELLEAARDTVAARQGAVRVDEWIDAGAEREPLWALEAATVHLTTRPR